jgi:hypothetical protein
MSWLFHHLVGHPVSGVLSAVGFENAANKFHDVTLPISGTIEREHTIYADESRNLMTLKAVDNPLYIMRVATGRLGRAMATWESLGWEVDPEIKARATFRAMSFFLIKEQPFF